MSGLKDKIVHMYAKPRVQSDIPGRLRLRFNHFKKLSKSVLPYLHYIGDVFYMIDGVRDVKLNTQIGTLLLIYDESHVSNKALLAWLDVVTDTGVKIADEAGKSIPADEKHIRRIAEKRLAKKLIVWKKTNEGKTK